MRLSAFTRRHRNRVLNDNDNSWTRHSDYGTISQSSVVSFAWIIYGRENALWNIALKNDVFLHQTSWPRPVPGPCMWEAQSHQKRIKCAAEEMECWELRKRAWWMEHAQLCSSCQYPVRPVRSCHVWPAAIGCLQGGNNQGEREKEKKKRKRTKVQKKVRKRAEKRKKKEGKNSERKHWKKEGSKEDSSLKRRREIQSCTGRHKRRN